MRLRVCFVLLVFLLGYGSLSAQGIIIRGDVRDTNTRRGLPSVNIFIKGTPIGTESDFAGRFSLPVAQPNPGMIVVFQHIAYDVLEIGLDSVRTLQHIYLQPRVIPLQGLTIEAQGERIEVEKDLPQTVSVIGSDVFEIRGYTDAGDLLQTDHSVQVDEDLSGEKTVSLRAGNPDEVIVLYNGVKMNSAFDNVFDFSLIDLEDVERLEIIKGSNTALYGSEALSGIVNVVPKTRQDYHIRFRQQIGTYRSGNWGINLYQDFDRLHTSYSYKQGGTQRQFSDVVTPDAGLENRVSHHTANLVYRFSENRDDHFLGAMYIDSFLEYDNRRDLEHLENRNQVASLSYEGSIYKLRDLSLSAAYHNADEAQDLREASQSRCRQIQDKSFRFDVEKRVARRRFDLLLAYQFAYSDLRLEDDVTTTSRSLQVSRFDRKHHGFVGIVKFYSPTGSKLMPTFDLDLSVRHDRVNDEQTDGQQRDIYEDYEETLPFAYFDVHAWEETIGKFATNLQGSSDRLAFKAYLSFGTNVKFPTLFQQVSSPSTVASPDASPSLDPEKNRSMEIGFEVIGDTRQHPTIYGWQLSGNFFKNFYKNKFRVYYTPGIPIAFYDNVKDAQITGIETKADVFLFRKKVTVEVGFSRFFVSEKAAFPFKYDVKSTLDFRVDHAGYAFQLHLFTEGEQVGWIREHTGGFAEVGIPGYTNLDLHLRKRFAVGKVGLLGNVSVRNVLNDDVELVGLALRDRRIYLTFGLEY